MLFRSTQVESIKMKLYFSYKSSRLNSIPIYRYKVMRFDWNSKYQRGLIERVMDGRGLTGCRSAADAGWQSSDSALPIRASLLTAVLAEFCN